MQTKLTILSLSHAFAMLLGAFLLRGCGEDTKVKIIESVVKDTVTITQYQPVTVTNIKTKYVQLHDTSFVPVGQHDTVCIDKGYTAYSDTINIGNGSQLQLSFSHPDKTFGVPYYKQKSDTIKIHIEKQLTEDKREPLESRSRFGLSVGVGAGVYRVGEITQVKPGIQLTLGYILF